MRGGSGLSGFYPVHPDDELHTQQLRNMLKLVRTSQGVTAKDLSLQLGRSPEFVTALETGRSSSPLVSSFQLWGEGLGMRVEFGLKDFWLDAWPASSEMSVLYALSRPWGAHHFHRLWLVAALRALRQRRGISIDVVAQKLGSTRGGALRWESDTTGPLLSRCQLQARATGTRVTWRLFSREEWVFG